MLKDEWLEYFEAVNGRKPRPIDFKEALERGEFVLSEGTEANQVADQGESAADQQFEEGTATARALAQSQKECDNAQEAMADAAVQAGMPRSQAYEFAAQSVLGSAKMVLETGKHPGELKDMVCSPGGTTIQAVKVLEEKGLRAAVMDAMDACIEKSKCM